ncbi:hypothetical protein NF212_08530 [Parasalinivibrio latis]|uniref:putative PEP-binding protein n=1 Tax=Parasalinivibrio latis TaxID=2952610 RepID=UPI0030E1F373
MSQMDFASTIVLNNIDQLENNINNVAVVQLATLAESELGLSPADILLGEVDGASKTKVTADSLVDYLTSLIEKAAGNSKAVNVMLYDKISNDAPVMGFRGVSGYRSTEGHAYFSAECSAIKAAISKGIKVDILVPFVRTASEAATAIDLLAEQGLVRGFEQLKVYLVSQLPANVLQTEALLAYFDGVFIDADSLAVFTLGTLGGDETPAYTVFKTNETVISLIHHALLQTEKSGKPGWLVTRGDGEAKKLVDKLELAAGSVVLA